MSEAINDLRHEHKAVEVALKILVGMTEKVASDGAVKPLDVLSLAGFFKEFVDKCHHGKEELHLFPALKAASPSDSGATVEALLQDHVDGRKWIQEMQASASPTLDAKRFAEAARRYTEMLQRHIQQEETVLFPLAERILGEATLGKLGDAFAAHEVQVIGAGRHEELHALLHCLGEKYQAPTSV